MIEKKKKYPAYESSNEHVKTRKALLTLDYEQILEIANVFFYVNKTVTSIPKIFGGIRLDEAKRALHKSVHDAAVNCALSLEEMDRYERESGGKNG
jgi:hypothetical protein